MTKLHAGGKFDEQAYKASGDCTELALAVNALSANMRVVVKRLKVLLSRICNWCTKSYRKGDYSSASSQTISISVKIFRNISEWNFGELFAR